MVILQELPLEEFGHWDLWLQKRKHEGLEPRFDVGDPLVGHGHRMSQTSRLGPVFAGCWLPGFEDDQQAMADLCLALAPPSVQV